jgi:hypothetical protein
MMAISKNIAGFTIGSTLLLAGIMPQLGITADDFEAYKQQQQQGVQQVKEEFRQYKEKQDKEFAGFLKAQWGNFDTYRGKVRIKEPKPRNIPVFVTPVPEPVKPGVAPPPVAPAPVVVAPLVPKILPPAPPQPKPIPLSADTLEIVFFGNAVQFKFDTQWQQYRLRGGARPEAMSDFWSMMSGSEYDATIKSINDVRSNLKLDDWGGVTLWRAVVQTLQPGRKSEQNLLLWFFLVKSGYDVRLGYAGSDVHLFVAMKQPVFSTKYVKVGNQTYYAVLAADYGDSIQSFYTYDASYPAKLRAMDIHSAATGFNKPVSANRILAFDYKGKNIKLTVPFDRGLIEYMETFPQSDFDLYFDTDGSAILRKGLLLQLKKYTANMSEEEKVDFLLTFVQSAFAYKTDKEQFGREKSFFVEESLYFPYNDCEDRAVIFSWLVRELAGLKVVGLLYPNHMSTAVALSYPKADYASVEVHGQKYVIADPTYIGASVGTPMPSYAHLRPSRVVEMQ